MSIVRRAALAAVLLAAAAPVAPAFAGCFGTASTASACVHPENVHVDPTGGPGYDDCVTVGNPEDCVRVHVPTPAVETTGPLVDGVVCTICDEVGPAVGGAVDTARGAAETVVDRADRTAEPVVNGLTNMQCLPARSVQSRSVLELRSLDRLRDNLDALIASCL